MSSTMYKFHCPLCGTAIASTESVELEEEHDTHGKLVHVRIHDGARVVHECESQ
jgi:hypothetical protein